MENAMFIAGVQYNDMTGTAAADANDFHSIAQYLKEKGKIHPDETLIGISMWSGEVRERTQDNEVYVNAFLARAEGYDNVKDAVDSGEPLQVRRVRLEMHLNEFFGLFKRFSICLSTGGLIDQKEIHITD